MMARSLSGALAANSMVVMPTVCVIAGPAQSFAQNTGLIFPIFCDHIGSAVMPVSTAPFITAEYIAPVSPAGSNCTSFLSMFADFRHIRISMLVTDPGEVKATFLPVKSFMEFKGEAGGANQTM